MNWPDGRIYEGQFRNDLRHGKGTYTFKDQSIYTGDWYLGK